MVEKKKTGGKQQAAPQAEILAIRGRLYSDLRFQLYGSYSTTYVRDWPEMPDGEYSVELRNDADEMLNREPLIVFESSSRPSVLTRCRRVAGYIALVPRAKTLEVRKGKILLRKFEVPKKPSIALRWNNRRVTRGKHFALGLKCSEPGPGAAVRLFYQWKERNLRPLGMVVPTARVPIDFSLLPGGDKCRLLVLYSNGLRSATAATPYFAVPKAVPVLTMLSPSDKSTFFPWHWVELEAELEDLQECAIGEEDFVWELDGKVVHVGRIGSLHDLTEGSHRITLRSCNSRVKAVTRTISIKRPKKLDFLPGKEWDREAASHTEEV
jgi:hypothetical protein